MNKLPIFKTDDDKLMLMQTRWASIIGPVIALAQNQGQVLESVSLSTGLNKINHKLGRKLQGWYITRLRAASSLYDTQDNNPNPEVSLYLNASADVVADIFVF